MDTYEFRRPGPIHFKCVIQIIFFAGNYDSDIAQIATIALKTSYPVTRGMFKHGPGEQTKLDQ